VQRHHQKYKQNFFQKEDVASFAKNSLRIFAKITQIYNPTKGAIAKSSCHFNQL
jgi:hypothetical protein